MEKSRIWDKHPGSATLLHCSDSGWTTRIIFSSSVADPVPGSGAFLTPGSGMGFFRIPDPEGLTSNFFHLSLLLLFLDPGSGINIPDLPHWSLSCKKNRQKTAYHRDEKVGDHLFPERVFAFLKIRSLTLLTFLGITGCPRLIRSPPSTYRLTKGQRWSSWQYGSRSWLSITT